LGESSQQWLRADELTAHKHLTHGASTADAVPTAKALWCSRTQRREGLIAGEARQQKRLLKLGSLNDTSWWCIPWQILEAHVELRH